MDFGPNAGILPQKYLKRVLWLEIALKEFVFREHDVIMFNFSTQIFPKHTFVEKDKVWACLECERQYKNEAVFKSDCSMSRSVRPFYKSRFWPAIKFIFCCNSAFWNITIPLALSSMYLVYSSQKSPTLLVLLYLIFFSQAAVCISLTCG